MNRASEVAPSTLPVELTEGGIEIEYLDGRQVFYHGVPSKTTERHRTTPQMDVHVLITDQDGTEGVLIYLNDRKTDGDILEDSGVGRVLLADSESTSVFPGVTVSRDGFAFEVEADFETVDGRVFVFEESEMAERRYEIIAER